MTRAPSGPDDRPVILVATVGGKPQPLHAAIAAVRPWKMRFIVSDGRDGSPSSRSMVEQSDPESGLGPLREHVDCPADNACVEAPADDPDRVMAICVSLLEQLKREHPEAQIIADYTGGTKSMTGGLLMAALGREGVDVQFMAGERADLQQVRAGTERASRMSPDYVLAARERARIDALVSAYDYGAALTVTDLLRQRISTASTVPKSFRADTEAMARTLVVFDLWDRFDFRGAWKLARDSFDQGHRVGEWLANAGLLAPLQALAEVGKEQSSLILVADLWLNAQRCARRGRYDDAVARVYRLCEALLQARLWEIHRLPNPVPLAAVPATFARQFRSVTGRKADGAPYEGLGLGLEGSRQLLTDLDAGDPAADALNAKAFREMLQMRNKSILAHGFRALSSADWGKVEGFVNTSLRPLWAAIEPPQLPNRLHR